MAFVALSKPLIKVIQEKFQIQKYTLHLGRLLVRICVLFHQLVSLTVHIHLMWLNWLIQPGSCSRAVGVNISSSIHQFSSITYLFCRKEENVMAVHRSCVHASFQWVGDNTEIFKDKRFVFLELTSNFKQAAHGSVWVVRGCGQVGWPEFKWNWMIQLFHTLNNCNFNLICLTIKKTFFNK